MKKFNRILSIDITSLSTSSIQRIQELSKNDFIQEKRHLSEIRIEELPRDADCLLVSLLTDVNSDLLNQLPNLKYIGVYGTSTKRIDLEECKRRNIHITNVSHYCDFETAEAILAYILNFYRKLGSFSNRAGPVRSLRGKSIGIIGMGGVGLELAKLTSGMKMRVSYFSRSRKPEIEAQLGIQFLSLHDLLRSQEVISLHTPPNLLILSEREFRELHPNALLINTCPGDVMDWKALENWMDHSSGHVIFDYFARQNLKQLPKNIIFMDQQAYRTEESIARLQDIFISNLQNFLSETLSSQ